MRRPSKKVNWPSNWLHPSTCNCPRQFQSEDKRKNTKQTFLKWNKHQVENAPELHFCCPRGLIGRHGKQRDLQTPLLQLQVHTSPMQLQALMRWRTRQILSEWVEISRPHSTTSLLSPAPNSPKEADKSSHQETWSFDQNSLEDNKSEEDVKDKPSLVSKWIPAASVTKM